MGKDAKATIIRKATKIIFKISIFLLTILEILSLILNKLITNSDCAIISKIINPKRTYIC